MQAQPDLGHRKISLPSLKMTQSASTKPVKASLKGSWTSSDGLPLLSPNALNRESLDVTILSPMIIVKPSKPLPIPTSPAPPPEKSKGEGTLQLSGEMLNQTDIREDTDGKKGDSYLIAISRPLGNGHDTIDNDSLYLQMLDPFKVPPEEQKNSTSGDLLSKKMQRFKPADSTIEEKFESSKKSQIEDESSFPKKLSSKLADASSSLNTKSQNMISRSNDKNKTDSLEFIKLDDSNSLRQPYKWTSVGAMHQQNSEKALSHILEGDSLDGKSSVGRGKPGNRSIFGKDQLSKAKNSNAFRPAKLERLDEDRKETFLNPQIEPSAHEDSQSSNEEGRSRKPKLSYSSKFNHSEYLERELYRSSFDNNTSHRMPALQQPVPLNKIDIEEKKRQKPRPDWQSDNSSVNHFAEFSSDD
jgi:hypothetical protein